jgi:hypothetical protein
MEGFYTQQIKELVGENETLKNEHSQIKMWLTAKIQEMQ